MKIINNLMIVFGLFLIISAHMSLRPNIMPQRNVICNGKDYIAKCDINRKQITVERKIRLEIVPQKKEGLIVIYTFMLKSNRVYKLLASGTRGIPEYSAKLASNQDGRYLEGCIDVLAILENDFCQEKLRKWKKVIKEFEINRYSNFLRASL